MQNGAAFAVARGHNIRPVKVGAVPVKFEPAAFEESGARDAEQGNKEDPKKHQKNQGITSARDDLPPILKVTPCLKDTFLGQNPVGGKQCRHCTALQVI